LSIEAHTESLCRHDSYNVKIFDARRSPIIDDGDPLVKASDIRMHVMPTGGTAPPPLKRRVNFWRAGDAIALLQWRASSTST
jgi:hypothetical protein